MPNYTYYFDLMNPNIQVVANTSYSFMNRGFTPDYIWCILAVFAMGLAILAIAWKLREPDGSVTPQKPMFAMLAMLVNFYTAWASLAIERVDGTGAAAQVIGNNANDAVQYVYAVSQHSVVQSASLAIFFMVVGLLMIVVFVHAILQKEMIKPSNDLQNDMGAGHE